MAEQIKLFNTLTRKKDIFKPIKKGQVGMYTCGPTVYWYQHIGNLRSYIFSDILRRTLEYNKLKVNHIINITDVGHLTSNNDTGSDKMELASSKEGKSAQQIADHYFSAFSTDLKKMNILSPKKWTPATQHIKEQIALIKTLEKKGYTYETSDGIYFNSSKFKNYGKLAKLNIEQLKAGKRISLGEKKNKTDFALWKFSLGAKRQQEWPSPWGVGFPGWHIECSAMSMKYLGPSFDIHTGGEDHIPVHHTNEIAQSEAATGKKFVNYWLHGAFLVNREGSKISKSKGGLYTLTELEELGYKPMHYRYLCLQTSYRKPLTFTLDNLDAARNAYQKIERRYLELKNKQHTAKDKSKEYSALFLKAINDDLNTPKALSIFIKALDDANFTTSKKLKLLTKFDSVLGLGINKIKPSSDKIPKEIIKLAKKREQFRLNKQFAESDVLRADIKELGYDVEDSPSGPIVRKL
tara:strand:+ start:2424 stop:3818 length:1395 start_codon:yes stop_codon:yes gene_type:complete